MKKNLVYLLFSVVVFASCSTAYKTSQTPDDVYYSPAKKITVADKYETYASSTDDEYLRMKVKDHDKWSSLDDYSYWYDSRYYQNNYYMPYTSSFAVSMGVGWGNPYWGYPYYSAYNPYFYNPWNSWYSPCYTVVYYKNPATYYKPVSKYTLSTYNNRGYNNYNMPLQNSKQSRMYNNSNTNYSRTNDSYYQSQRSNSTPSRSFNSGSMSSGGGSRVSGGGMRTRP